MEKINTQERKLIGLYRELSKEHQHEAISYLKDLAKEELGTVKRKVKAIQENLIESKGLTRREANLAAKVGLIAEDQKWWWTEEWQAGEREAEADIQAGRVVGPMTIKELIKELNE